MAGSQLKTERPRLRVIDGGAGGTPQRPRDEEVLAAFERGERHAAELLYDCLDHTVGITLVKVMGKRDPEHDDLVQSAFEQILLTIVQRRFGRACSLTSWAISVTTHVALSAIRKRRTERRHVDDDPGLRHLHVASQAASPERAAQLAPLREELACLSPTTAHVLLLHEVMGCRLAEVAALTGLSVSAAQSRLVRGREELRRRLENAPAERTP